MSNALSPAVVPNAAAGAVEDRRPVIALFIPSLGIGGAERQATYLASNLDPRKWRVLLVTLDDQLRGRKGIAAVRELAAILERERVDILQAFLLGAQVYALGAKMLRRNVKLVAAVRSSMGADQIVGMKGKISHKLVFAFHRMVDHYVFNSRAGERDVGRHLPPSRRRVIANGIDTARFRADSSGYLRKVAGIRDDERVVGIVANINSWWIGGGSGRLDKGYETFVRAAAMVPDACFVVIGDYQNAEGDRIRKLVDDLGLSSRFRFLGSRGDVERLVPGMHVVVSASTSEGFSNSVAEAMACAVPCVVTDVGDSAFIVGDTGVVVPPRDPAALANGIQRLLSADRAKLGAAARERVVHCFGIEKMVQSYEALYESLLHGDRSV